MLQETKKQLNCILHWTGSNVSVNAPKVITAVGDAKQILPFPGAGIGMFDGTGDCLLNTDTYQFTIGLTIEFSCRFNTVGVVQTLVHVGTANNFGIQFQLSATNYISVYISSGDASWNINSTASSTTVIVVNTWYHVALVWTGTTYTLYVNGLTERTFSSSVAPAASSRLAMGGRHNSNPGYDQYIIGNMSELRISDVARYTANFTPPRRQLESDANTKLLLHFLGSGNTFVDSSPSPKTITAYGDAKQLSSSCGSGIAYLDGNGDSLSIATHADWDIGTNYTVEFTVIFNAVGKIQFIIARDISGYYASFEVYINATNKIEYRISTNGTSWATGGVGTGSTTLTANTKYHIALVKTGSKIVLYLNGIPEIATTLTGSPQNNSALILIGTYYGGGSYLDGCLSEIRISKDIARYTSAFTPSTRPFKPDPYTKLLLHMDGVGNAFYDASDAPGDNGFLVLPDGVSITPAGTFTTIELASGQEILVFDGSTNYITITDHALWDFWNSDLTICLWAKFANITGTKGIIGQYASGDSRAYVYLSGGDIGLVGKISSTVYTFDYNVTSAITSANTWYHIAIVRSGNLCLIYINAVSQSVTITTAFNGTTAIGAVMSIGKINTVYHTGNIKDLHIFKRALSQDQIAKLMDDTFVY